MYQQGSKQTQAGKYKQTRLNELDALYKHWSLSISHVRRFIHPGTLFEVAHFDFHAAACLWRLRRALHGGRGCTPCRAAAHSGLLNTAAEGDRNGGADQERKSDTALWYETSKRNETKKAAKEDGTGTKPG